MGDRYLEYAIRQRAGLAKIDRTKDWALVEVGSGWKRYGVPMSAWWFELLVRAPDETTAGAGVIGEYRLFQPSGDLLASRKVGQVPDAMARFEARARRRALEQLQQRDRGRKRNARTGFFLEG